MQLAKAWSRTFNLRSANSHEGEKPWNLITPPVLVLDRLIMTPRRNIISRVTMIQNENVTFRSVLTVENISEFSKAQVRVAL